MRNQKTGGQSNPGLMQADFILFITRLKIFIMEAEP